MMFVSDDRSYYLDREQKERALANAAADPSAKAIHEELAARYHGIARATEPQEPGETCQLATG